jgi:hypothetical protein
VEGKDGIDHDASIFEDWILGESDSGTGLEACRVTLRDTTGQEAFDAINKGSCMNMDTIMLAFSLNSDQFGTSLANIVVKVRQQRGFSLLLHARGHCVF